MTLPRPSPRACFFGTYNRGHSANRIYAAAVRAAGYELVECHVPLWEKTRDKGAGYFGPLSLLRHALSWVDAALRLAWRWHRSGGAPVAVVGFNGQLDVLLLRLMTWRHGPRIVFAPLVSISETLVEDRQIYRAGSFPARALAVLDRLSCRAADVVITDTEEHRRYLVDKLGVSPSTLLVCHLGVDNRAFSCDSGSEAAASHARGFAAQAADDGGAGSSGRAGSGGGAGSAGRVGHADGGAGSAVDDGADVAAARVGMGRESADGDGVEILYFGQYLPLHGLEVVVDAVGRLASHKDLRFVFIGSGEDRPRIERLLRATRARVEFIDWVAYEDLAARVRRADIVLGIFGDSLKARMVIPNKVYEAAALGKAVVSAGYPAIREVFADGKDVVLCAPDGASLAAALERLAGDAELRRELGEAARRLMAERFSDQAQGQQWAFALSPWPASRFVRAGDEDAPALGAWADSGAQGRPAPLLGVCVVNYNDSEATIRCLRSLAKADYPNTEILVVDSGSQAPDASRVADAVSSHGGASFLPLPANRGYAGANNEGLERLFGQGCDYVLVLNNDTIVTPQAPGLLVACARRRPHAGPIGPRIARDWPGMPPASLGERCIAVAAWLPRSLIRYRRPRQRDYAVGAVIGAAFLLSREVYEALGGFDERYFAYYDEIDYCLRARRHGRRPRVEPMAEIAHRGHRGFAAGMTPVAAYLKARNLWKLASHHLGTLGMAAFAPGYAVMLVASLCGYALRRRFDIVGAMLEGAAAGLHGEDGAPPERLHTRFGSLAES